MQITFLVGNGFDVSAGINTSYRQFCEWYCQHPSSTYKDDDETIKQFKKDIIKNEKNYWSDLEIGLGRYTENFTIDNADAYVKCYEDAHNKISEFIAQSECKYNKNLITDKAIDSFCDGLLNFYQELPPKERAVFKDLLKKDEYRSTTLHFISFNYSNILDWYISESSKDNKSLKTWTYRGTKCSMNIDPNIIHIHGKTNFFPILGVSERKYVANQQLLKNSDINCSLLKENSNDRIGYLWYEDSTNRIEQSSIICIFGMSLGESDSLWWKKIMLWLNKDNNRQLIVFWHTEEPKNNISIVSLNNDIEKVKNTFSAYVTTTPEKLETLKNRIHVVTNAEKMFNIPSK